MIRWSSITAILLSLIGYAPSKIDGRSIEKSMRPITLDEEAYLETQRKIFTQEVSHDVRARYEDALSGKGHASSTDDLTAIGVMFGDLVAKNSPMTWVSVEYEGQRLLAMNYPKTSVILFPIAMIEKRAARGEVIDLPTLVSNTIATIERSIQNPEYQR